MKYHLQTRLQDFLIVSLTIQRDGQIWYFRGGQV